jgi:hypothetical protein
MAFVFSAECALFQFLNKEIHENDTRTKNNTDRTILKTCFLVELVSQGNLGLKSSTDPRVVRLNIRYIPLSCSIIVSPYSVPTLTAALSANDKFSEEEL